jgi:hypothetical protein
MGYPLLNRRDVLHYIVNYSVVPYNLIATI